MPKFRIDMVCLIEADTAEEASEEAWQSLGAVLDAHNAFQRALTQPTFDLEPYDYICKGEVNDPASEEFRLQVLEDFNR